MRPKDTSEDREFVKQVQKSLSVTSYFDEILDKVYNDKDIDPNIVPDFGEETSKGSGFINESDSPYRLDTTAIFHTAAKALGPDGMSSALDATVPQVSTSNISQPNVPLPPKRILSDNQIKALKKYPALIEFLGGEQGEAIVKEILGKVNKLMIESIGKNTKEISKHAQVCVAERQNIKQYFAGENNEWVCVVIASGPFRGDEAFLYKVAEDKSYILRKKGDDYEDASSAFNLVHEFAKKEKNG